MKVRPKVRREAGYCSAGNARRMKRRRVEPKQEWREIRDINGRVVRRIPL